MSYESHLNKMNGNLSDICLTNQYIKVKFKAKCWHEIISAVKYYFTVINIFNVIEKFFLILEKNSSANYAINN